MQSPTLALETSPRPLTRHAAATVITLLLVVAPWSERGFALVAMAGSVFGWSVLLTNWWAKAKSAPSTNLNAQSLWVLMCVAYLGLHLVQMDGLSEIRKLDSPARVFLLSGLAVLPMLARGSLERWWIALTVSGTAFGLIAVSEFLKVEGSARIFGHFKYFNLMSLAAVVTSMLLVTLLGTAKRRRDIFLLLMGHTGCWIAAALSGTRAAWLLVVLIWPVYRWSARRWSFDGPAEPQRRWPLVLALAVSVVAVGVGAVYTRGSETATDLAQIARGDKTGSIGARLQMAGMALDMIGEKPWTGHGLSEFQRRMQAGADERNLPADAMERGFQNPHNQYLHWGQSLGLPAALVALSIVLIAPLGLMRGATGPERSAALGVLACFAVFFLAEAVVDRHQGASWYTAYAGLLIGWCRASQRQTARPSA